MKDMYENNGVSVNVDWKAALFTPHIESLFGRKTLVLKLFELIMSSMCQRCNVAINLGGCDNMK
jgi:hypothetical protein